MKGPQEFRTAKDYNLPMTEPIATDEFENNDNYQRQIAALKHENEYLRSFASRLETELRVYQTRLPELASKHKDEIESIEEKSGFIEDLPPWVASSKYMSPLLVAYENRIQELTKQAQSYQDQARELSQQCEEIANRNKELETEYGNKFESLYKRLIDSQNNRITFSSNINGVNKIDNNNNNNEDNTNENIDNSNSNWIDDTQFRELKQRLAIACEQNELLRQTQIHFKDEKLKLETKIETLEQTISSQKAEILKKSQFTKEFESEMKELKDCKNKIENDLYEQRTEYKILDSKYNDILSRNKELLQTIKTKDDKIEELNNKFEQFNIEYNNDLNEYQRNINILNENNNEITERYESLLKSFEQANDNNINLTNEIKETKKDLKNCIESLDTVEKLLNKYKTNESNLLNAINILTAEKEQFRIENMKLISTNNDLKMEVKRINERIKTEMQNSYKDCEKKIKENTLEFEQKIKSLNNEINTITKENYQLISNKTLLLEQITKLKNEITSLSKLLNDTNIKLSDQINSLKVELTEKTEIATQTKEKAERLSDDLDKQQELWKKEREIMDVQYKELNKLQDKKDIELIELRDKNNDLIQKCEQLETNLQEITTQHETYIKRTKEKLSKKAIDYENELNLYKEQLCKLEKLKLESENEAKSLVKQQNELTIRWRNENRATILEFDKTMNQLKKENELINSENIELQSRVSKLLKERNEAMSSHEILHKKEQEYENELTMRESEIMTLKSEINGARESETVMMEQTKQLRKDLDRTEMENKRLQRLVKYNERKALAQSAIHVMDDTYTFQTMSKNPSSFSTRDIARNPSSSTLFAQSPNRTE